MDIRKLFAKKNDKQAEGPDQPEDNGSDSANEDTLEAEGAEPSCDPLVRYVHTRTTAVQAVDRSHSSSASRYSGMQTSAGCTNTWGGMLQAEGQDGQSAMEGIP